MQKIPFIFLIGILFYACNKDLPEMEENPDNKTGQLYFPPTISSEWNNIPLDNLNWNQNAISDLLQLVEENATRAFMLLKDGKIVIEEYWGEDQFGQTFDKNSMWYWASAGKTLTPF